jgi:Na+/H+-translocating membrane pyrophosphatase
MKEETDLSYLSAFYYTAAVLLILMSVFAAMSQSWWMAGACFILGSVLFGYRARGTGKQDGPPSH